MGVIPKYDGGGHEPADADRAADAPAASAHPATAQQQQGEPPRPPLPAHPANEVEAQWLSLIRSPDGWWDNRRNKRNPKAPDFKAKQEDHALWIDSRSTPEWVAANLPPPRG